MTRPLRLAYPGALYHVTTRGNARQAIYTDDQDRSTFLAVLAAVVTRSQWLCYAYCLMNNHYHLLIETPQGNLSAGMRQLNGVYTHPKVSLTALFVWMSRFVATPFPLTLSLSRKGRGNPRTASSCKCKPL